MFDTVVELVDYFFYFTFKMLRKKSCRYTSNMFVCLSLQCANFLYNPSTWGLLQTSEKFMEMLPLWALSSQVLAGQVGWPAAESA